MQTHTSQRKSKKELRKFGLTMAAAFSLFALLFWWRGVGVYVYLIAIAGLFLLPALAFPVALRPIERGWMKIAELLGAVMTRVILTLAFFLVITPFGLLMRLFGHDPMHRRFDAASSSYWEPVEADGPASRPDKPY